MDNEIGQAVRNFNELGAYNDLVNYIKETAENKNKEYLLDYLKPLEAYCTDDVRVIVTTHKKFLNSKDEVLQNFEIIIDEDILSSSVKNSSRVLISDIQKIKSFKKAYQFLSQIKDRQLIQNTMK